MLDLIINEYALDTGIFSVLGGNTLLVFMILRRNINREKGRKYYDQGLLATWIKQRDIKCSLNLDKNTVSKAIQTLKKLEWLYVEEEKNYPNTTKYYILGKKDNKGKEQLFAQIKLNDLYNHIKRYAERKETDVYHLDSVEKHTEVCRYLSVDPYKKIKNRDNVSYESLGHDVLINHTPSMNKSDTVYESLGDIKYSKEKRLKKEIIVKEKVARSENSLPSGNLASSADLGNSEQVPHSTHPSDSLENEKAEEDENLEIIGSEMKKDELGKEEINRDEMNTEKSNKKKDRFLEKELDSNKKEDHENLEKDEMSNRKKKNEKYEESIKKGNSADVVNFPTAEKPNSVFDKMLGGLDEEGSSSTTITLEKVSHSLSNGLEPPSSTHDNPSTNKGAQRPIQKPSEKPTKRKRSELKRLQGLWDRRLKQKFPHVPNPGWSTIETQILKNAVKFYDNSEHSGIELAEIVINYVFDNWGYFQATYRPNESYPVVRYVFCEKLRKDLVQKAGSVSVKIREKIMSENEKVYREWYAKHPYKKAPDHIRLPYLKEIGKI